MSNIDKQALRTVAMLAKELSGISMYSKAIAAINKFHELFTPDVALTLLDEVEHYKSREERVTKLVLDNSASWDELYKKLEAAEKRIADQQGIILSARQFISEYAASGDVGADEFVKVIDRAATWGVKYIPLAGNSPVTSDGNGSTVGKALTITLPDTSSKAFWSGSGKTEVFHPETYKRWVKEAIERYCAIAGIEVRVK